MCWGLISMNQCCKVNHRLKFPGFRPGLANREHREDPRRAGLVFGPVFSRGTGLKYITDAVPGLPALAAYSKSAVWLMTAADGITSPDCTLQSEVCVGGCRK